MTSPEPSGTAVCVCGEDATPQHRLMCLDLAVELAEWLAEASLRSIIHIGES